MSDTVKLVIEIPKSAYKACRELRTNNDDGIIGLCAINAIADGILLDDVKAKIREHCERYADGDIIADEVIQAVDNIDKAESEE